MKIVFFDLFETLVTHFDPEWTPPATTIAQRRGIQDDTYRELWKSADAAWQMGQVEGYATALAQVARNAGSNPSVATLTCLEDEYRTMTQRVFEKIELDVLEMLSALKTAGFRLGIITNAGDLDTAFWHECVLATYFDEFVASHEVGLLKRDPQMFELACDRLNVSPAEAIFVGDGGGGELSGAAQAGMKVYWVTWFLDQWPPGIRPSDFEGGEWRQFPELHQSPFERVRSTADLLAKVT